MKDARCEQNVCGPEFRSGSSDTTSSPTRSTSSAALPPPRAAPGFRFEVALLRRVLRAVGDPPVAIALWSGDEVGPAGSSPVARVLIRDRWTFWKLVIDPLFGFPEAYAEGRVEVGGDLDELLVVLYRGLSERRARGTPADRLSRWFHRRRGSSLANSRDNIHRHYDLGNDFYELWLDEQLVYTCAYFADPSWTLEKAQEAKMDHVCRKLRLQPGEFVVEAGCGWGALALHMARHYGVTVKAFNISHEQTVYARQRAHQENLDDRVQFVEDDWRHIRDACDVFVSVGMLEHVGRSNYERLGDVIHRCLGPCGRGLLHSIGQNHARPLNAWIERRIFPGAYPPTLAEAMRVFESHDFSVLDVENLRLHYAETLRHWRARFEQSAETVRAKFGERFVRAWRMYLCGSKAAFETGSLQLFQILFARGSFNDLPRTRAALYVADAALRDFAPTLREPMDSRPRPR